MRKLVQLNSLIYLKSCKYENLIVGYVLFDLCAEEDKIKIVLCWYKFMYIDWFSFESCVIFIRTRKLYSDWFLICKQTKSVKFEGGFHFYRPPLVLIAYSRTLSLSFRCGRAFYDGNFRLKAERLRLSICIMLIFKVIVF